MGAWVKMRGTSIPKEWKTEGFSRGGVGVWNVMLKLWGGRNHRGRSRQELQENA